MALVVGAMGCLVLGYCASWWWKLREDAPEQPSLRSIERRESLEALRLSAAGIDAATRDHLIGAIEDMEERADGFLRRLDQLERLGQSRN
jgi:hypothetical protein